MLILAKNSGKQNVSFWLKTRVSLKYFNNDSRFIKETSIFWVALLCFSFTKTFVKLNLYSFFHYVFSHIPSFLLYKNNLNISNFRGFLPPFEPLVPTFNETRVPTSRKYVAEQGIVMPISSKTFQTFSFHSSVFALEKQPNKSKFSGFFNLWETLWWLFSMKHFQKICSWARGSDAKLTATISNFLVVLLRFGFKMQVKNLNFQSFLSSKKPFSGYFQWKACTYS